MNCTFWKGLVTWQVVAKKLKSSLWHICCPMTMGAIYGSDCSGHPWQLDDCSMTRPFVSMQGGVACETIPQLGLVSLSLVNWVCSFIYRNFLLHLSPNRKIFSSDFAAYVVDGSNNEERHPLDIDEFYHGYLDGKSFGTREGGRESLGRMSGRVEDIIVATL